MTYATSSHTDVSTPEGPAKLHRFFGLWPRLLVALTCLTVLLLLLPDGVADAAQALIGWLVVGLLAVIAVITIVKGFERLLDCDTS